MSLAVIEHLATPQAAEGAGLPRLPKPDELRSTKEKPSLPPNMEPKHKGWIDNLADFLEGLGQKIQGAICPTEEQAWADACARGECA